MGLVAGLIAFVGLLPDGVEGANATLPTVATHSDAPVHLSISPENPWVKPGEAVTIALNVDGGVGISAAELSLSYGKDVEVLDVKPGPYLGKDTLAAPKSLNEESHQATYAWARIGETPAQATPSELALITLKAADGYPWNTWVTAKTSLADGQFNKLPSISLPFNLYVYESLAVPVLVQPASQLYSDSGLTDPQPVFRLKTLSPATVKYKIEVSRDGFHTVLRTFDQTTSPQGWDKAEYHSGDVARFISPEPLLPGQFQWRAYAWIQELEQWGQPSGPESFEVISEPMGLTAVIPAVLTELGAQGAPVTLEGWGFTPDIQVRLSMPEKSDLAAQVQWENSSKIKVIVPPDAPPGLVAITLSRQGARTLTASVLVFPPALFTLQTELPWANQVVPGKEFSAGILAFNYGTDPDGVAVVAVRLPNPELFRLLEVTIDGGGQVLEQRPEQVLLAARDRSQATFKFRLTDGQVNFPGSVGTRSYSIGDSLDFDLQPVVLGAVPAARWEELESLQVSQRVDVVQTESAQELGHLAQTLNQASYRSLRSALQQLAASGNSLGPAAELISQLQHHGLDLDRLNALMSDAPLEIQASLFPVYSDEPRTSRLQVVSSITANTLLASPEGVGEESYIAEDQPISYTIRFENSPKATDTVKDITVMAQLGPGMDLEKFSFSSSYPRETSVETDVLRHTVTWVLKDINLPPNTAPTNGEGWVRLTARPLEGTPSGTKIIAKAAIRLDSGPPIETNEVSYTLDSQAPSTQVSAMPSIQLSPTFQVPWQGGDEVGGSGIEKVNLLVSRNGDPFEFVATTADAPLSFQGEPGATYGLATQAIDQVGHVELSPSEADIVVTVGQPLTLDPGLHLLGIPVVPNEYSQGSLAALGGAWSDWDTSEQKYDSKDPKIAAFPVEVASPGHGLWAEFKNRAKVLITGQTVPDDQPYTIELHAGWNLIANPFASAVPWSIDQVKVKAEAREVSVRDAQRLGWTEDFLWGWDGAAYQLIYDSNVVPNIGSSLEPFQGYWIEAHRDLTLVLPPPRQ